MTLPTILKMIETVEPGDDVALHNIDTAVWLYLYLKPGMPVAIPAHPKYTRSRDALKQIRPEGWCFRQVYIHYGMSYTIAQIALPMGENTFLQMEAKLSGEKEELSELHAILQAIEHDRTNK